MSYVTYPHFCRDDAELHLPWDGPMARTIGRGLARFAGGVLFATTMYLLIVLPDLLG